MRAPAFLAALALACAAAHGEPDAAQLGEAQGYPLVMVLTSVWPQPSGQQDPAPGQERGALWRGVLRSLGGATD